MSDRQERIRARAYELWEKAGQPEGQDAAHWAEAERWVEEQESSARVEAGVNPDQTGPAQPDQIETTEAPVPVKRRKKPSLKPTRKSAEPE